MKYVCVCISLCVIREVHCTSGKHQELLHGKVTVKMSLVKSYTPFKIQLKFYFLRPSFLLLNKHNLCFHSVL